MADNYDDYSKEQLLRLLRERDRRPNFGLVWERDEIDHDLSVNNDFVALDWDAGLSCGDGPQENLIIEGDNFDALRTLRMTHAGRVKCIYIDPPYNTGKRDFIYNDRFIDKDDSYRHSKWLEFMYRRLELAKELLTEDGVIFVSIDDNEIFHLGVLMEQVFGLGNRVGVMVWNNVTDNNPTRIAVEHEYIVCYSLNIDSCATPWKSAEHDIKDQMLELEANLLLKGGTAAQLQKAYSAWFKEHKNGLPPLDNYKYFDLGGIYAGSRSVHNPGKEGYRYDVMHPETGKPCKQPLMGYRFPEDTMSDLLKEKRILFGDDHTKLIELKIYLRDYRRKLSSVVELDGRAGPNELKEIFGDESKVFNNPKPIGLIQELLSFVTSPGDIILDFFAGSGTTAQAVMNLNKEDKGNRRFILVSSTEATPETPDKNLCRDVCSERVRRVITGYTNKKGESVTGLGGGFAYLRCRRIPAATVFRGIQHAQIWTALQLIHEVALSPYQASLSMQIAQGKRGMVIYLPKINDVVLDALHTAVQSVAQAVVYSWQPALLMQRLTDPRLAFEPIPAFLVNRFGARSSAKGGRP